MNLRKINPLRILSRLLIVLGFLFTSGIALSGTAQAATLFVANTDVSGVGSLYHALHTAPVGAIIRFDTKNCPCVYTLDAELTIDRTLTIIGAGAENTIIEIKSQSRLFTITGRNVVLENLSIVGGQATNGGAMYVDGGGSLQISQSTFKRNNVTGSGGAIFIAQTGGLTVEDSEFEGNSAQNAGAIYSEGDMLISGSTFYRNTAGNIGGAIVTGVGKSTIVNSTFTENSANAIAGAIATMGNTTIVNTTIAGNKSQDGGGIAVAKGSNTVVQNTIIANNTGKAGVENCLIGTGGKMSGITNLEFGAAKLTCAKAGFKIRNPKLAKLAKDTLGSTRTMAIDKTSPAYNSGTLKICQAVPVNKRDQRGAQRPQGKGCDIGAYELGDLVAPALTSTPTVKPSNTPKPSVTPRPSSTPKPSSTPRPSATPRPTR